ncbi:MAG TPA: sulfotransferase domain-containing protein [Anaerolineales bacterium]|nr:sulfotransferase domain-containing protein [Anaerolineales bacterium]
MIFPEVEVNLHFPIPQRLRIITGGLRILPDFMIIGAQKGGTTSLYRLLEKHPSILPAAKKEVHFFDNVNYNFRNGLNWYRAHFPMLISQSYKKWMHSQSAITGEATPYYIFHPEVPARVFRATPNVKLIAMLRDPVARAYSHYHHNVRKGLEQLTFEEAIALEQERLAGESEKLQADKNFFSHNHMHYSYLSRGLYLQQLINWHRYFPKEQVLVLRSEDFFSDPIGIYQRVLNFLGLPEWDLDQYSKHNDGGGYPTMNSETRDRLIEYFHPHNLRLQEYLGLDFGWCFSKS